MPLLRAKDEVAYVRFASVYRSFRDLEEFRAELEKIARDRPASEPPPLTPSRPAAAVPVRTPDLAKDQPQ